MCGSECERHAVVRTLSAPRFFFLIPFSISHVLAAVDNNGVTQGSVIFFVRFVTGVVPEQEKAAKAEEYKAEAETIKAEQEEAEAEEAGGEEEGR